ncbi:MAG: cell division protein ZapA [Chloracidobacterium sp. CP2_5A]|nr:MAG: cell division protein ZapA [Chloracidobacterium sp. CP2_5A]
MANPREAGTQTVEVRIYGQVYNIRGDGNSAYISELAAYVDRKMREIMSSTHTVDSLRVAILSALNIADELFQANRRIEQLDAVVGERSHDYANLIDSVLRKDKSDKSPATEASSK